MHVVQRDTENLVKHSRDITNLELAHLQWNNVRFLPHIHMHEHRYTHMHAYTHTCGREGDKSLNDHPLCW